MKMNMMNDIYNGIEQIGLLDPFPVEKVFKRYMKTRYGYFLLLQPFFMFPNFRYNFLDDDSWDYAIVLDACRYDVFEKASKEIKIGGCLKKIVSPASATSEWVRRCINKNYPDTLLVTANPRLSNIELKKQTGCSKRFFANVPAWEIGLDDDLMTCPPWAMIEIIKKRLVRYSGIPRMVFWFNQPHQPYFDEYNKYSKGWDKSVLDHGRRGWGVWGYLSDGVIDKDELKKAYAKHLRNTLREIKKLIEILSGRIIITSDHGNCFGEMGIMGHPQNVHIPPLVNVPFFRVKN